MKAWRESFVPIDNAHLQKDLQDKRVGQNNKNICGKKMKKIQAPIILAMPKIPKTNKYAIKSQIKRF